MTHRRPLIAGNWKMNGSLATNAALLSELTSGVVNLGELQSDVAVCVPAPYLMQVQAALQNSKVRWGAQDVSSQLNGAYTGEVSATMLQDFSCFYTLVGHSERRVYHAESDAVVAIKALRSLEAGLAPVICVGESLQERKAGYTEQVVGRQLTAVLEALNKSDLSKIVVAYEPVWAVGTGITATPEMAQQVHAYLRGIIAKFDQAVAERVQILYGGSMKPDNALALLAMPDIDGGLIGGAALKSTEFLGIIAAAIK